MTPRGLVAAVQMGTIELHIWGSTIDKLDAADRLVFDLDPDPSVTFETVKQAAISLRDALEELGLKSVAMVSGGKGIHVIVPPSRRAPWEDAKAFAKGLSARIADNDPDNYIATMSKAKRKGRIFIDWLRNERGSTAVALYSVRARAGGPVATPVSWDELAGLDAANGFHIPDIIERLESGTDPVGRGKGLETRPDQGNAGSCKDERLMSALAQKSLAQSLRQPPRPSLPVDNGDDHLGGDQ